MSIQAVALILTLFSTLGYALEDKDFWQKVAKEELERALKIKWNEGRAKNVIIFIGDGMGVNTITASMIYKGGEQSKFIFEKFPHIGLSKTYSTDKQVPDSACTATAIYSGVKTNYNVLGLQATVEPPDCKESLDEKNQIENLFTWAHAAGKRTGFVTTTRVTHATPAAIFAHCPNRHWECEAFIPKNITEGCKDIGRQLVEDENGKNLNVIMGGGRQCLVSNSSEAPNDPIDKTSCYRMDGRNLINEWTEEKQQNGFSHAVVTNTEELEKLERNTDFVLGVFANSHLSYDYIRDKSPKGMPSLQQMTSVALNLLYKGTNGFFLMVEGGLIDFAHHRGLARIALDETVAFEKAIDWTMTWLEANKLLEETLVIVTADHDHGLSFNGIPDRGNNILGIAQVSEVDGIPFTTLTYGTGGVNNYQYTSVDGKIIRNDPSKQDTTDFLYTAQTAILVNHVKHGGGDVIIYATGPMAHLFHNVHEQNYIAYVAAYASKIGPYRSGAASTVLASSLVLLLYILSTLNVFHYHKIYLDHPNKIN